MGNIQAKQKLGPCCNKPELGLSCNIGQRAVETRLKACFNARTMAIRLNDEENMIICALKLVINAFTTLNLLWENVHKVTAIWQQWPSSSGVPSHHKNIFTALPSKPKQ